MRLAIAPLILLVVTGACHKDHPQCEKFVDLAFQCDTSLKTAASDEKKTARMMMDNMCEEAFRDDVHGVSGDTKQIVAEVYAEMRKRANCAASATSCQQYNVCAPD